MSRFLTLNVGASKAVLAEYTLSGKRKLTLTAYGDAPLVAEAEATGSLSASLTPALHAIMREKGIKPAPLVVSLSGQMVFPRFAKFPAVSTEKLDELVRYEVEQNIPFPIDEMVWDYQFVGDTADGEKAAMIVATKHEQVSEVTSAVAAAGLSPKIVDVAPMAVYNILKATHPQLDGCTVVLDIGSRTTNLILVEGEKIYNRSIPVAGNAITKEIVATFNCTPDEAEQLKIERGYVSLGGVTEDDDEVTDRVSKVIRSVFTRLNAEISRSINFYRSQQGGSAPTRLLLTGGTVRLPQLDEFFRTSLGIEVAYLNPFDCVGVGGKVDATALEGDAFTLAESAGLALRMTDQAAIGINLVPPELVEHARAMRRIPFLVVGALAVWGALALAYVAQNQGAAAAERQKDAVEARNGKIKSEDALLKKAQQEVEAACAASADVQKLLYDRVAALQRLRAVRESLVPGMWITRWEEKGESVLVTVRGWAEDMDKIEKSWSAANGGKTATAAEIVQNALKRKAVFAADSVKIEMQRATKEFLREFSIRLSFKPAPSVAEASAPAAGGKKKKKGAQ